MKFHSLKSLAIIMGICLFIPLAEARICAVYFTGVGCPHCAKTDPVILGDLLKKFPDLIIIEYEIYQQSENAPLLYSFSSQYNTGLGVPLIIFKENNYIIGDLPILNNIESVIESIETNDCPLIDGSSISFEKLNLTALPGKPKIWKGERILIYSEGGGNSSLLKELLIAKNVSSILEGKKYEFIEPKAVALSGRYVKFDNAIKVNGWIFEWNGEKIGRKAKVVESAQREKVGEKVVSTKITPTTIISLAAVDAVNPCALAVLTLMLIAILTYNPKKKRNVLLAGFAFTISVFSIYLFYGLVLIKFFQLIQFITSVRLVLYKVLGIGAILLGILQIKDFVRYKPGGFLTEMPLKWRPKVKKIISGITSPRGAFIVGAFVTIFLLPCTIGPYIIASGILSVIKLIRTIPWLLLYNLIFVLPMLIITLIVYFGIAKIEDISGWKEKNIRYLHLTAGIIILLLGLGMLIGLV